MKFTPFLTAVALGATVTTALQPLDARFTSGGAGSPQPTGHMHSGAGGQTGHSHHGHHHSFTGMSGAFTMNADEAQPTGDAQQHQKQKRGHARGGNPQSNSGEHTFVGGNQFPSGASSSNTRHHTGAGGGHFTGVPSFTFTEGAQQTGAMVRKRDTGHRGHHSHGGHQSMSQEHQTVTRVSQVHIPTTFTMMVTANGR